MYNYMMAQKVLPRSRKRPGSINDGALTVLAIGLAFGLGVIFEWGPLNGAVSITRWEWPWQDLGTFEMGLGLLVPFLLIAWVLWTLNKSVSQVSQARGRLLAGFLAISNFSLQIFSMVADPRGFRRVQQIVASPDATSYYTDAISIQGFRLWMSHFHQAALHGHSSTHPAGPIAFYYAFLKLFEPETAALLGGCAVGLAGSIGVLVMYRFAELWTPDRRLRLFASAFYAMLPALIVFFPEFDQVYPIFSMLLVLTWVRGLDGSLAQSACLGVVLFVATFFAYNLLATGAFLAYYGLYYVWRKAGTWLAWASLLRSAATAVSVCAVLYLTLWFASGYNAPASFVHAMASQASTSAALSRPYATFVLSDPYDFSLGAGIIAVPLMFLHLKGMLTQFKADRTDAALTLIGLATILTVDVSGLLRGETARVWLFLQPFLVVPVAIEISRFSWPWRFSIFAMQWWLVVCIKAKMSFVEP